MSENMYGIALILMGMIVVHKLMAFPQIRRLNRQLAEIKKSGPVSSVGLCKSWKGNKAYVLITDLDGKILSGYCTEGTTVFAGFKPDKTLEAVHYSDLLKKLNQKEKLSRVESAQKMAAEYLEEGFTGRQEIAENSECEKQPAIAEM